jgi:hypothetical protein
MDDIDFHPETAGVTVQAQVNRHTAPTETRYACYCTHTASPYAYPGPEPLLRPTVKTLIFHSLRFFPMCTLDYLVERCRGTLEKFAIEDCPEIPDNLRVTPSMEDIRSRMTRLVRESIPTLRSFTFFQNWADLGFLSEVATLPNLTLHELILGVYKDPLIRRRRHTPPGHGQDTAAFLELIRSQEGKELRGLFFKTPYTVST